jgi:hypothetical protein
LQVYGFGRGHDPDCPDESADLCATSIDVERAQGTRKICRQEAVTVRQVWNQLLRRGCRQPRFAASEFGFYLAQALGDYNGRAEHAARDGVRQISYLPFKLGNLLGVSHLLLPASKPRADTAQRLLDHLGRKQLLLNAREKPGLDLGAPEISIVVACLSV